MSNMNSPFDVFVALHRYGDGEMTWEQVKEVAADVEYGPWPPSGFGDPEGVETFDDAISLAKYNKTITPEQVDELRSIGVIPTEAG